MYRIMTHDMVVTHQQDLTEAIQPSSFQTTPLEP